VLRVSLYLCAQSHKKQFFERYKLELNQALLGEATHEEYLRDFERAFAEIQLRQKWLSGFHVFVLAHVLRRPIFVYGPRSTELGKAEYENDLRGIYLPLLCRHTAAVCRDPTTCSLNPSKQPLLLGYSRSHFSALVLTDEDGADTPTIPLETMDVEEGGRRVTKLPLRYLTDLEKKREPELLSRFLNLERLVNGSLCARLRQDAGRTTSARMTASLWRTFLEGAKRLYAEPPSALGILVPTRTPSLDTARASKPEPAMDDEDGEDEEAQLQRAVTMSLSAMFGVDKEEPAA